ncbi:hypothetical protein BD408DRAFT_388889 [Parasitella parasitica]|nr:hypothetical protein BD408DRAFT_388889 [Parasitella parasitica]
MSTTTISMKHDLQDKKSASKQKRFKVGKACFTCRVKKIKCDGLQPCMQCKARSRPCTFSKDGSVLETTNEQDAESLHTTPSPPTSRSSTPPAPIAHSSPKFKKPLPIDQKSLSSTTEILNRLNKLWPAEGKEGKWELDPTKLLTTKLTMSSSDHTFGIEYLPSKSIQHAHIQAYFKNCYSVFPIIPKRIFFKQFDSPIQHYTASYLLSPILLLMIMAHGAQQAQDDECDTWFQHAKSIVLQQQCNKPKLSTVIALALMSQFQSTRNPYPSMYSAMAFQMCLDLNLMRNYTGEMDIKNDMLYQDETDGGSDLKELQKRVCWGCYTLDKLIHIQTGQPWMLKSKDIDLDMPLLQPGDDVTEHQILETFVCSIKLLQIAERTLHHEQQQLPAIRTHAYDQMALTSDNTLLDWLRSLPLHLQWTPALNNSNALTTPTAPSNIMVFHLHILYNIIELCVLKPYVSSTAKSIQTRSAAVATHLVRLVSALTDNHAAWYYNYDFTTYALIESIKFHIGYCSCENFVLARHARFMFQQSMPAMKKLLPMIRTASTLDKITQFAVNLENAISEADTNAATDSVFGQDDIMTPFVLGSLNARYGDEERQQWSKLEYFANGLITPPTVKSKPSISMSSTMFQHDWRATPDRLQYTKINNTNTNNPLEFLHNQHPPQWLPATAVAATKKRSGSTADASTSDLTDIDALVAQIQENNNSPSSNNSSSSSTAIVGATVAMVANENENLLYSLLSDRSSAPNNTSATIPTRNQSYSNFVQPYMNVGLGIYASAHQHHNDSKKDAMHPAVIIPQSANVPSNITYNQMLDIIYDFSRKLAAQVPASALAPGRSISISYPNSFEFTVAFLGATFMSQIASPLNPAYTEDEFNFYLEDAKSSIMILPKGALNEKNNAAVRAAHKQGAIVVEIHWNGTCMEINARVPLALADEPHRIINEFTPRPDEPALLLHTSGTTGRPKGVPLSHLNLLTSMRNIVGTYELNPEDRTLLVMPLFHVHGLLCGLLATLLSGGVAVIPAKFSASHFWKDFVDNKCNWYTAVPTIHQILLRNPPSQVPAIRFIRSCSSSLAPATLKALEKHFKAPVLEAYAMTEASHQMTSNPLPHRGPHKAGSVGLGQGVEIAILDQAGNPTELGEVCIRGKNVTKGYLNNPKATAESFTKDGYFRTGDQGKKDKDGYLILTGRIKELINRGGEKISPIELDSVMLSHPKIAEAVSFAVPDEMYGQEVHAAVVLKSDVKDSEKAIEKELQAYCASKLAKFKVPKRIYVTDIMPKTATGKIQRRKVSEVFFKGPAPAQAKL